MSSIETGAESVKIWIVRRLDSMKVASYSRLITESTQHVRRALSGRTRSAAEIGPVFV